MERQMILVTGATGLNGKAIVREFARQKHQVRALVRDLNRASAAGLGGLAGVELVVKFSGAESNIGYDATKFRFTRMHEEVERYLEGAGMAWTHLRPSQFMQVYLRDAPTIAAEGAFYLALGGTELSPVDVEDIAKVAVRLLRDGCHE